MLRYTEQEIIAGCKKRDPVYEEYLYKTYYSTFLALCARYATDMPDAKQLLNDGFVRIFMNIGSFRHEGSFEGWMRKTMVNTCLDYLKSNHLRNSMTMQLNENIIDQDTQVSYNDGLQNIGFKELISLVQTLPVVTRTVFNLFVFEEYTHKEIAGILNMSEGTSYWHVHHARNLLQKKIKSKNSEIQLYERKRI
jgi:RNA polymerase sigma-70 factor (ECF subfamily)